MACPITTLLLSPTILLPPSTPGTQSLLFHEHAKHYPAPGPLHLLFLWPRMLFP